MEENIYQAPHSNIQQSELNSLELAERWPRLGGAIVDGLIVIPAKVLPFLDMY